MLIRIFAERFWERKKTQLSMQQQYPFSPKQVGFETQYVPSTKREMNKKKKINIYEASIKDYLNPVHSSGMRIAAFHDIKHATRWKNKNYFLILEPIL